MNYQQTLDLLSRRGNEVQGIHLGLHRITAIAQALGNPQNRYPALHIAGTNGKGSVAAMSEAILRAAGWKTGLYTSPHLENVRERIRIAGRNISERKFARAASRVASLEEDLTARGALDMRLTFFEFLTACAFLSFAEERVEVAVVEVGLGGRLDATNILSPQSCVITGVALDHQDLLGATLRQIAAEKAGILKPGVPAVSGCRAIDAQKVVRARARRLRAPLTEIDRDCRVRVVGQQKPAGCRGAPLIIDVTTPLRRYQKLCLALAGLHQARNAALAIAGVEALLERPVSPEDIRKGLARTRWPGRLDTYHARRRTLLEGAHNVEGARALRNELIRCEDCEIHLVFGALGGKDFRRMGALLFPLARSLHLAPIANSRSAAPEDIARAHPRHRSRMRLHGDALSALRAAWDACPADGLVVVTGSLYLLGELLPAVRAATRKK